jgi:hypothetical protein
MRAARGAHAHALRAAMKKLVRVLFYTYFAN